MATLKKYDLKGQGKGEVQFDDNLLQIPVNSQLIKDYIIAIRANQRQWSASTQTRGEVSHSKRKPFAQKGTGNARQGFLGATQFRGGGRPHGPRPKFDQHVRINRKERRLAIRHLLGQSIKEDSAHVLEYAPLESPKTKTLAEFLAKIGLNGKRTLVLAEGGVNNNFGTLAKSLRNLPRVSFNTVSNVNGEDLALCHQLVILDTAVEDIKSTLGGK